MEKSIPYSQKRAARVAAVQVLYQIHLGQMDGETAVQEFHDYHLIHILEDQQKSIDWKFLREIIEGVMAHQASVHDYIIQTLPDTWKFDRLELLIKCILEAATLELAVHLKTDVPIIISEYLYVTEAFYTSKEAKFINGILHNIALKIRPSV